MHTSHGFTLYGDLKYPAGFTHFDFANPDAPKGGTFTYGWSNSFDTLHPFIVLGTPPAFFVIETTIYDRLMVRAGGRKIVSLERLGQDMDFPGSGKMAESYLAALLIEIKQAG